MTLDLLRFTTAGAVDDGKSTLIGRLLFDSKQVFEDQLEHVAQASERRGGAGALDLALLTDGLKAEQIPITARIISVVDGFDSVREDRPFRRGMTRDEAVALLRRGAGNHFDPNLVR